MKKISKIMSLISALCIINSMFCVNISAAPTYYPYDAVVREMLDKGMSHTEIIEQLLENGNEKMRFKVSISPEIKVISRDCEAEFQIGNEKILIVTKDSNTFTEVVDGLTNSGELYELIATPSEVLNLNKLGAFTHMEVALNLTPFEQKLKDIKILRKQLDEADYEVQLCISLADGEKIEDYITDDTTYIEYEMFAPNSYYLRATPDILQKDIDIYENEIRNNADNVFNSKIKGMSVNSVEPLIPHTHLYEEMIGDINFDGKADLTDLSELSLALIGDKELTKSQQILADVDGDGAVKLADLAKFRQYLSKVISSLDNN